MFDHSHFLAPIMVGLVFATPSQSLAASSEWQDIGGGKARISAIKDPVSGRISGLVEVALHEGWKTYWKSPGGSGIAPEFDFSRSVDFFPQPVSFPVPEWIVLPDATFYGYTNSVAFPFSAEGGNQTAINLDLLIGVCEEICIPATASFSLDADSLNRSDPKVSVQLSLAKSTLPNELADTMPQTAKSLRVDRKENSITVTGKLPDGDAAYRVVLEAEGRWVSDPLKPVLTGKKFEAAFGLPKPVTAAKAPLDWRISLIQHSEGNAAVTAVFETDLTVPK